MKSLLKIGFVLTIPLLFICCGSNSGSDKTINERGDVNSISVRDSISAPGNETVGIKKTKLNKQNLVIKEWNTNLLTNTKFLDHVTTYNPEGKKIEEIEYNTEGQKWRERYEYDANGNKSQELLYDGNNRLVTIKKYEYNEFGNKKITYTYNAKGKLIAIKNYEYITQ